MGRSRSSIPDKICGNRRLKEKEPELGEETACLIGQAKRCDAEEDRASQDRTGYEIPEDLKHKESRLAWVKEVNQALEKREQALNPGKPIEDKKQIILKTAIGYHSRAPNGVELTEQRHSGRDCRNPEAKDGKPELHPCILDVGTPWRQE